MIAATDGPTIRRDTLRYPALRVLVVVFGMKADRTIVASLNDVPRNTGKRQTGAARHGGGLGRMTGSGSLAEIIVACPLLLLRSDRRERG